MRKGIAGLLSTVMMLSAGMGLHYEQVKGTYENEPVTEIRTAEELFRISEDVSGNYRLMQDIALTDEESSDNTTDCYLPIVFEGKFDGNGHTISGMQKGLFLENARNAGIYNVTLETAFPGETNQGISCDDVSVKTAMVLRNKGRIDNCTVNCHWEKEKVASCECLYLYGFCEENLGVIAESKAAIRVEEIPDNILGGYLAGIAGCNGGTIRDCEVYISVRDNEIEQMYVAGICQENAFISAKEAEEGTALFGTITGCSTTGEVASAKDRDMEFGGMTIVNRGIIEGCENAITGDLVTVCSGGIVARNEHIIRQCVNKGYLKLRGGLEGFDSSLGEITGKESGKSMDCSSEGQLVFAEPELRQEIIMIPMDQGLPGDVDGDGEITIQDVILLRKYLAGYSVLQMEPAKGDMDGDGKVTSQDVVVLLQYLAGYSV